MNSDVFLSHSSADKEDANALASALNHAFNHSIRMFNTSSGVQIKAGDKWRQAILDALRNTRAVILWYTPSAEHSNEVAFEIGAAFAYAKRIIPCSVHISPAKLPWSLSELQAVALDTEEGWLKLGSSLATALEFTESVNEA